MNDWMWCLLVPSKFFHLFVVQAAILILWGVGMFFVVVGKFKVQVLEHPENNRAEMEGFLKQSSKTSVVQFLQGVK